MEQLTKIRKGTEVRTSGGVNESCLFFLPYLWFYWRKAPPPPEVCTRASVCADVVPLWNVQHSPEHRLLKRHRGFPRAPPARRHCRPQGSCRPDQRPPPCWASSGAQLGGEPADGRRVAERSQLHRPQGLGCTRSRLHRLRHSPQPGQCFEDEGTPWPHQHLSE